MRPIAILSAGLLTAMTAMPLSAATLTFDFQNNGANNSVVQSFTQSGYSLAVVSGGGNIAQSNNGLGVTGGTPDAEGGRIAGGETLTFAFGPQGIASLQARIFENGAESETFSVLVNGIETPFVVAANPGNGIVDFDFSSLLPSGGTNVFTIKGTQADGTGSRGIKLASLTISPVPIPAAGLLLLTAIGGLTFARRKQQMTTA